MNKAYHSPAVYCIRGKAHTVRVASDHAVDSVYAVSYGTKIDLEPIKSCDKFTLWQGDLLSTDCIDSLQYSLYADSDLIGDYTIPMADLKLSPLTITETVLNMRRKSPTLYIEIANTTDHPIDLTEYQIMYQCWLSAGETPIYAMPITSSTGEAVLPPHALCVLWLAHTSSHDAKAPCLTEADFCAKLESVFEWQNYKLDPSKIRIFRQEAAELVEKNGVNVWRDKPNFKEFPKLRVWEKTRVCISRVGGSFEDAVTRATLNDQYPNEWDWHTHIRRASLWKPDVIGGADVICTDNFADITPGTLNKGQIIPNPTLDLPVCIAPLDLPNTHFLNDGELSLHFLAEGAGNCTLVLSDGSRIAAEENNGVWTLIISEKFLTEREVLCGYIEADGGTYITRLELPSITLVDNAGPAATILYPEKGYTAELGADIQFSAIAYDRSGINANASHLFLDGEEIIDKSVDSSGNINCNLSGLSHGRHELVLELCDLLGNVSRTESYFIVAETSAMNCYRGEIHSHTSDSDGIATIDDAMTYARDVGKVDYFAITDHNHYITDKRYQEQLEIADRYNEAGKFATLRGWEMTWNNEESGFWGHLNVLESPDVHHDYRNMSMPQLFDFINERPTAFGMFNHPNYKWGNFNEFGHYSPKADEAMCLIEVKNSSEDLEQALALTKGWHVSPLSNEDSHGYNWTTKTNRYGYVLAPGLSRQNIVEALRSRRTYSTSNSSLHMSFKVNGAWLGSRIPATDMLSVDIRLDCDRPEGLGLLSLIGEDNITVLQWDLGALKHFEETVSISCEFDYYYLKLINPIVPNDYTISAPVWIEGRNSLSINNMGISLANGDSPNLINASIENTCDTIITDLRADFYLTEASGFNTSIAIPYCSLKLNNLNSKEVVNACEVFPNLTNRRRVSVIVHGQLNGRKITATRYIILAPAVISEILPDSSPHILENGTTINNPFSYAVISNRTNSDLALDRYSLNQTTDAGKAPSSDQIHALDKIILPARNSAVIWFRRSNSGLTANDFCSRYGCDLTEGKSLFILDGQSLVGSHERAMRLELTLKDETISRVNWNFGVDIGTQPTTDRALRYLYNGDVTVTSTLVNDSADPLSDFKN